MSDLIVADLFGDEKPTPPKVTERDVLAALRNRYAILSKDFRIRYAIAVPKRQSSKMGLRP